MTSPGNHLNRHVAHNSVSLSDADFTRNSTGTDHAPIQFSTREIQKSFQELLKRQPVAAPGPTLLHGKTQRRPSNPNRDVKQRNHLLPNPPSNTPPARRASKARANSTVGSNLSSSLSHSPIFGSPASEHAKHWIKTVGRDQNTDTESEQSDQDVPEDNQQPQWQIDYENDVAGQVELETETDSSRKQAETSSTSTASLSWTNKAQSLFNMAAPSPSGSLPAPRIKDQPIHPLSPVPPQLRSGTPISGLPPTRSPEIPPQKTPQFDIPPISGAALQPLPPLPPPPTTAPDKPPSRSKLPKHPETTKRAPKSDRPPVRIAPSHLERKPVSLSNPPRQFIHHGKILQVINHSTVKDRYLFLFNDILLIAKHMSEGNPSLDGRFQVKDVLELKTISLSLTRDKNDLKNGVVPGTGAGAGAGAHSNRKIPPILAEFIHTFDQNPTRALNTFIQKKALTPDHSSVADLLFKTPELSKSQLATFLSQSSNKRVYRSFLDLCQFGNVPLDEALRTLLSRLSLPDRVSAQRTGADRTPNGVDYLLDEFARRWYDANTNVVVFDASIAHKLVIAMIVLNAQLHNNEGANLVKDREEVGILVRPRIGSQPSTPTISSIPIMDSNLVVPLTTTSQLYMSLELDDLSAFPKPSKETFAEMFQLLDQQRIVPKDTLHNIYWSISHQPLDLDSDKMTANTPNAASTGSTARKLLPVMMSPANLPSRLIIRSTSDPSTTKAISDPITITIPAPNPYFTIHLSGRDLKCEPSVLEFGSHRSQLFRITGSVPGKKTLTIQPKLSPGRGWPERYYDFKNLPANHTIAIERQFMRHTFQVSMLNDLGKRRYLFSTSTGPEKDEWGRVLTDYLHEAKGQNAARLNEHTGVEKSIGLQILKDLLLGVEASDEDEADASRTNGTPEAGAGPVPPPTLGPEGLHVHPGKGAAARRSTISVAGSLSGITTSSIHAMPKPGSGGNLDRNSILSLNINNNNNANNANATVVSAGSISPKDSWMCRMPKAGTEAPIRGGHDLVKLVEQNSLMALLLGFMGAIGRDRMRRIEETRKDEDRTRGRFAAVMTVAAAASTTSGNSSSASASGSRSGSVNAAEVDSDDYVDDDDDDDEYYDMDEELDLEENDGDSREKLGYSTLEPVEEVPAESMTYQGVTPPIRINVEQVPDTTRRFSLRPRSVSMAESGVFPKVMPLSLPNPQEPLSVPVVAGTSGAAAGARAGQSDDEEGEVQEVSGTVRKVQGKEAWWGGKP